MKTAIWVGDLGGHSELYLVPSLQGLMRLMCGELQLETKQGQSRKWQQRLKMSVGRFLMHAVLPKQSCRYSVETNTLPKQSIGLAHITWVIHFSGNVVQNPTPGHTAGSRG